MSPGREPGGARAARPRRRRRVRPQGPTARALALAAAGVAALVASRGFGTSALATLGAGMVALPALVTALVWAAAAGLRLERRIEPARCRAGDAVVVRLSVSGWPARAGVLRLLDLTLDPGLGSVAGEPAVGRLGDRAWRVPAVPRGDHRLPPARLRLADPFGLARRSRRGAGDERLLAVPWAPAIRRIAPGARPEGRLRRRPPPRSGFGELERVRDYQTGDPVSRVHWGQTAKRGRLQTKVLRGADASAGTLLVLLDGAAPAGPDLETAVTAAAALARHAAERGDPFALCHTGRVPARLPAGRASWAAAELALARLEPGGERSLALALREQAAGPEPIDRVAVVTSAGDPGLAAAVEQVRRLGASVGVVLAGAAAAAAVQLTRAGADVAVVAGQGDVGPALSAAGARARVS